MTLPVAFIIFNRPDTTARVFAEIRRYRPEVLLVVADGPRSNRPGETDRCAQTRAIIDQVDWPCEVRRNYSEMNLGCRRRVSSGLDWVFEQVEAAIILEDDCLPHEDFFPFCEELIRRYADDERIMAVLGSNFQGGRQRGLDSYFFTRMPHVWGWASWRRAWRHYDVDMAQWRAVREGGWLEDVTGDARQAMRWRRIFDKVQAGGIDTWDLQWTFACWIQHGLAVMPSVNLIANIGFGINATHTTAGSEVAALPTAPLSRPLRHPPFMIRDTVAERRADAMFWPGFWGKVRRRLRRWISQR